MMSDTVMPARLLFDDRLWPKVYVTWPNESVTDEEFMRSLDQISSYTARAQPYVIIHDARRTVRPSPKQRALAAERQKRDADASRRPIRRKSAPDSRTPRLGSRHSYTSRNDGVMLILSSHTTR